MRTKFVLAYFLVIAVFLVLLNTYFLIASRDMIFASKQAFVQSQAALVATTFEDVFDSLDEEDVHRVMQQLEGLAEISYIVITDETGHVLYESVDSRQRENYPIAYIYRALYGRDVVYTRFAEGAFLSWASSPILSFGTVIGLVYVHEEDTEQGSLLMEMQGTLQTISVIVVVLSVAVVLIIFRFVMRRITSVLNAIISVREGEYSYKIRVTGNDEIALLGDEFNSLTDRLRETDEIRRDFVANASHELKTPLASIKLLSDSILQNEGIEIETVQEFVGDIGTEAERLARTTEKLMALTRLDNDLPLNYTSVDACNAVNSVVRRLVPFAQSKAVELFCNLEESLYVYGSDDSIDQIIYNLVENAIKYNTPNGSVIVGLRTEGQTVVLTVEDTGIGVPDEDMPYIFDRFYRVDKARSRDAGGSGLGLSIVKDTVYKLNGSVDAEKRKNGGMRFTVILMRNASADAS